MNALVRNIGSNCQSRIGNERRNSGLPPARHRISHSVIAGAPLQTRQTSGGSAHISIEGGGGKTHAVELTGVLPTRLGQILVSEFSPGQFSEPLWTRCGGAVAALGLGGRSDSKLERKAVCAAPVTRGGAV